MKKVTLVANLATAMMIASIVPAAAQVCGDTLGPGGTFTLTADIGPCTGPGTPALTIVGPVKVDLNGHRITCDSMNASDGILIQGTAASVTGGSVRGCDAYSVRVAGTGKHSVSSIAVKGGADNGIGVDVQSDGNKLIDVSVVASGNGFNLAGNKGKLEGLLASSSDDEGIILSGDGNKITRLSAINSTKEGILISGSNNKIQDCDSISSGNEGVQIDGNANSLKDCTASMGVGHGFAIDGASNSIVDSDSSNNDSKGFNLSATGTSVRDSSAINNGGDGFFLEGGPQTLSGARASSNGGNGIQVDSGTGHTVTRSVALESGGSNDVRDNTSCTGNTWTDNTFGSSNHVCIQ